MESIALFSALILTSPCRLACGYETNAANRVFGRFRRFGRDDGTALKRGTGNV